MDKNLLELLLPLVNDPHNMEGLVAYANYRIALAHKALENPSLPTDSMRFYQGQIDEMRKLIDLRDKVNGEAKRP